MSTSTIPETAVLPSGRLRVPAHKGEQYIRDYRKGWRDSMKGGSRAYETGNHSWAYEDGYLDACNREDQKWHLSWCTNHDNREGGCGRA